MWRSSLGRDCLADSKLTLTSEFSPNGRFAPEAAFRRSDVMDNGSRFRLEPHGLDDAVPDGAGEIDLYRPVAVHLQLDLGAGGPRLAAVGGLGRVHGMRHRHRWHIC